MLSCEGKEAKGIKNAKKGVTQIKGCFFFPLLQMGSIMYVCVPEIFSLPWIQEAPSLHLTQEAKYDSFSPSIYL